MPIDGRCPHCFQIVLGFPGKPTPMHRRPTEQGTCSGSGLPLQSR